MSADGKDRRSHDFINYYKTITMPYSRETFNTLDKWMRYAYKVCINYAELFIRMYKSKGQSRMDNPEQMATLSTRDTGQINVRENRWGNQE